MKKYLYLTTPIYYVNSLPHLGHAYTTIVADALAKFYRFWGYKVFFLTGTDEHGDKIVKAAVKEGKSPQQFVDEVAQAFQQTWQNLQISYDYFIRTTSPQHKRVVQLVLQTLYEKGEFYLDEYEGNYCFGCERFLTNKELDEEGRCKDHKTPPVYLKEKNYFFPLEKYRTWLKDYLYKEDLIAPSFYKEEVLNLLEEPLAPLCISRPKSRLTWGIELPFDVNYVTYVWFDALLNYLSGIGYPDHPDWQNYWANSYHIIAKDILRPHTIYFPIMLKALGLPVYKKLYVHGYWLMECLKMSKSLGNIVSPTELVSTFGLDQVRYYLLREMAFGYDAEFSYANLITRINADLANDYGNLINRTLVLVERHFASKVPPYAEIASEDQQFRAVVEAGVKRYVEEFQKLNFHTALEEVWQAIRFANVYIDRQAPWAKIKEGKKDRAGTILRNLLSAIKTFALALYPALPLSSQVILHNLHLSLENLKPEDLWDWNLPKDECNITKGAPLFPRVENKIEECRMDREVPESSKELISIEEFKKIDLRIAQIEHAERIPGTDKLLKLEISCPERKIIVAGIAEFYKPEDLVGKEVVIVANLKPTKIRGVLSQGMLLAAKDAKGLSLVIPEKEREPGAKVG